MNAFPHSVRVMSSISGSLHKSMAAVASDTLLFVAAARFDVVVDGVVLLDEDELTVLDGDDDDGEAWDDAASDSFFC